MKVIIRDHQTEKKIDQIPHEELLPCINFLTMTLKKMSLRSRR